MVGLFITIFFGVFQGSLIIGDNDHKHYCCFNGHEFDKVLLLLRHV